MANCDFILASNIFRSLALLCLICAEATCFSRISLLSESLYLLVNFFLYFQLHNFGVLTATENVFWSMRLYSMLVTRSRYMELGGLSVADDSLMTSSATTLLIQAAKKRLLFNTSLFEISKRFTNVWSYVGSVVIFSDFITIKVCLWTAYVRDVHGNFMHVCIKLNKSEFTFSVSSRTTQVKRSQIVNRKKRGINFFHLQSEFYCERK